MLRFAKMHSAGNHFVVLHEPAAAEGAECALPDLARRLCRHHFGIGAEGLIVLSRRAAAPWRVRMFNPDGTEDTCGNGTLCALAFLYQEGCAAKGETVVQTRSGSMSARIEGPKEAPAVALCLGVPSFRPESIPALADGPDVLRKEIAVAGERVSISSVGVGTTHTVIFADDPAALQDDGRFFRLSPQIERLPMFPERTSVVWAEIVAPDLVRIRTWERGGVGESLACGTGACAVVAIGHRLGLLAPGATVRCRGGDLSASLDEQGRVWLRGRPVRVYDGEVGARADPLD